MKQRNSAELLIEQLELNAHPEGGWYRETWRSASRGESDRASGTAILFLLKSGEASHWHRVDAEELWIWQAGDPLELQIESCTHGKVDTLTLSSDLARGHGLQGLVPAGAWQAARPQAGGAAGYCLVSCVVVPGFEFAGFELASPGWAPDSESVS